MAKPWLNFEAGAVSNTEWSSKVCTYLFGIKPADITGPLTQFQHTNCTKDDTLLLVSIINTADKGKVHLKTRYWRGHSPSFGLNSRAH